MSPKSVQFQTTSQCFPDEFIVINDKNWNPLAQVVYLSRICADRPWDFPMSRLLSGTPASGKFKCPITTLSLFGPEEYRHIEGVVSEETLFFGIIVEQIIQPAGPGRFSKV